MFPETARPYHWLKSLPVESDHILFCDFSIPSLASKCRELSGRLDRRNTIVHTHFVGDLRLLAVKLAFPHVICHYHFMVPFGYTLMKKVKRLVRWFIYRKVILIGVSDAVTEDMHRYFRKPICECIPNAVDFQRMEECSAGTELPAGYQGEGSFRVMAHGSDFYGKGADLAVRAVQSLNRQEPGGFSLYITSNDVQAARDEVEKLAPGDSSIHADRTVENVIKLYSSMDLFLSPSREDAFGYSVVEAAWSDCQVAASNIRGQNTLKVIPGVFWFEMDNLEELQQVILEARERVRSGAAASIKAEQRAFVEKTYGIQEWVQHNLDVYKKYFGI